MHTQKNIQSVESVQRRAARFVTNNYSPYTSVTNMLTDLGRKPLSYRRNKLRFLMFYKIVHHLVDMNVDSYLTYSTAINTHHPWPQQEISTTVHQDKHLSPLILSE